MRQIYAGGANGVIVILLVESDNKPELSILPPVILSLKLKIVTVNANLALYPNGVNGLTVPLLEWFQHV